MDCTGVPVSVEPVLPVYKSNLCIGMLKPSIGLMEFKYKLPTVLELFQSLYRRTFKKKKILFVTSPQSCCIITIYYIYFRSGKPEREELLDLKIKLIGLLPIRVVYIVQTCKTPVTILISTPDENCSLVCATIRIL